MALRRGYPAWLAAERRGPVVGPGMRRVIESEWLRGNLELQWTVGEREAQHVRHELGMAYPMDSEAIIAQFAFPPGYVVTDRYVGQDRGAVALAGMRTTQRLAPAQQRLREAWWQDWRSVARSRETVDFEPEPLTGSESAWRLLDHEVWLLARPGPDGPTFFPEPGEDGFFVTALHVAPGPDHKLPAHHHWRVAAMRDVVRLLPGGSGILLDPGTPAARRLSVDDVAELGRQAVAFPAGAAISWALARPAWLARLRSRAILDKLAENTALQRLWVAAYRVGDGDERVLFAYEEKAGASRQLADAVYRGASELRRCYPGVAATLGAVPDEGRAWLEAQQPVIG